MFGVNFNPTAKQLRIFAILLVLFSIFLANAVGKTSGSFEAALAVVLAAMTIAVMGWFVPSVLRWTYIVMTLAVWPIGFVVSHLLLAAAYYFVITPFGLVMRLSGRDAMQRRFDPKVETYWITRPPRENVSRYFRQF